MPQRLINGFLQFRKEEYEGEDARMPRLVREGQDPDFFIISCIDSRANPAKLFKAPPGTFFSFRSMGAIVRPYKQGTALSAGLQFAFEYNQVKELILLGHTGCGAIQALINDLDDPEINSFINVAQTGLEQARHKCGENCGAEDLHRYAEEEILLQSRGNLAGYPGVAGALERGQIKKIRTWLFDMQAGQLLTYDEEAKTFRSLTE